MGLTSFIRGTVDGDARQLARMAVRHARSSGSLKDAAQTVRSLVLELERLGVVRNQRI